MFAALWLCVGLLRLLQWGRNSAIHLHHVTNLCHADCNALLSLLLFLPYSSPRLLSSFPPRSAQPEEPKEGGAVGVVQWGEREELKDLYSLFTERVSLVGCWKVDLRLVCVCVVVVMCVGVVCVC